ncbi:MAG: hypothetical protein ABI572_08315 [Actinomycetota bacterium]
MSAPARKLQEPAALPARTVPTRAAPAARPTAGRPPLASPPQPRARPRRGFHLAFWILSATVVSAIVVAIVALNAMVVNTTYRLEGAQQALVDLRAERESLSIEVATRSAPAEIAAWATERHMVKPEDVVILRVAGVGSGA